MEHERLRFLFASFLRLPVFVPLGAVKVAPDTYQGEKMMTDDFCKEVICRFENNKIDAVFCYIQNDKDLMKMYLDIVAEKGLDTVNRYVGKSVTRHYRTKAAVDAGNQKANSTLVQSYSKLEGEL